MAIDLVDVSRLIALRMKKDRSLCTPHRDLLCQELTGGGSSRSSASSITRTIRFFAGGIAIAAEHDLVQISTD